MQETVFDSLVQFSRFWICIIHSKYMAQSQVSFFMGHPVVVSQRALQHSQCHMCFTHIASNMERNTAQFVHATLCSFSRFSEYYRFTGLKMTDYESFCNALKISWIKRLNDENNNGFWKQNVLIELDRFGGNYIWYSNFDTRWIKKQHISSHFLRNVLESWQIYSYESPGSALACGNQGLWHNYFIL